MGFPVLEGGDDLTDGIALCLSGGGYRAMLFHCGTLWRLNELGILRTLARVSSVSGGSITAGLLGAAWRELDFGADGRARQLEPLVIDRLLALAGSTIDVGAIAVGLLPGASAGGRVEHAYRTHLFGEKTLQDLPSDAEGPRFVINATSVQTGTLFRFSRPYAGDYQVGRMRDPSVPLAEVVAASSAFPPFLSPIEIDTSKATWFPDEGLPELRELRGRAVLSDGGVYDNLGLETAYKRYRTLLVSDAGQHIKVEPSPHSDWARHALRTLDVIDNQVRSLRKRQLLAALTSGTYTGAYFGIRTSPDAYPVRPHAPVDAAHARELAETPTRLASLEEPLRKRLVNLGYVLTDVAIRSYVAKDAAPPETLPYPQVGI